MNCRQIEPKLYAYGQGLVEEQERIIIEKHLASCNICKENYLEWQQVERIFTTYEVIEPPVDFTSDVMRVINKIYPPIKKVQLADIYKNIGKGLIAVGILGLLINGWVYMDDIALEKSLDKAYNLVENMGAKYFQLYDKVSLNFETWNNKGGAIK